MDVLPDSKYPKSRIVDADALPGNSGSPVLDGEGYVIGMVHSVYVPDSVPNPGPQGFDVIPYGGITVFLPAALIVEKLFAH